MRFVANLSMLFPDLPFHLRFAAARAAGFDSVELLFPQGLNGGDVAALLREHGLTQLLAGLPGSPDDKGLAAALGKESQFRERFARGLAYAVEAQAPLLHVTTGVVEAANLSVSGDTFAANMRWAAGMAARENVCLVLEAINQADVPGYFLRSLADTVSWIKWLDLPNVRLILDLYHVAREGLPLVQAVDAGLPWARHVQVADPHGRHEPVIAGEFALALQLIDRRRGDATIGCEYRPAGDTVAGLAWMAALRDALDRCAKGHWPAFDEKAEPPRFPVSPFNCVSERCAYAGFPSARLNQLNTCGKTWASPSSITRWTYRRVGGAATVLRCVEIVRAW